MKLIHTLTFILSLLLIPVHSAHSADLSPQARLRKLSLHIRGITPEAEDYENLKKASHENSEEDFFALKTQEYLKSPQHVGKMMTRLDELFKVRPTSYPPEIIGLDDSVELEQGKFNNDQSRMRNSMDELFRAIPKYNRSWDQLLLAKDYTLFRNYINNLAVDNKSIPQSVYESGFFDSLVPDTVYTNRKSLMTRFEFDKDDLRVAGALTTWRFVTRYTNSDINRNRRRSAAIYRIFLCDVMRPTATASEKDTQELFDLTFPKSATQGSALSSHAEQKHGTDAACMACHHKLDPMGQTLDGLGSILFEAPYPGSLVIDHIDGSIEKQPARGLGELALEITRSPEYASCQVRHFWEWFIGRDIPLSESRLAELRDKFDSVGRRTNDFVAFLVNQPEFIRIPGAVLSKSALYYRANQRLASCNSCHVASSGQSGLPPSFLQFPIGGSPENHTRWLKKISVAFIF